MKKYRLLLWGLGILFLGSLIILPLSLSQVSGGQNHYYRVEINRLEERATKHLEELLTGKYVFDLSEFDYVNKVQFMDASEKDSQVIADFYLKNANQQIEIVPLVNQGRIVGYLKMSYEIPLDRNAYVSWALLWLSAIFLPLYGILWFTYFRIIKPFHILSTMPYELSKGNLEGTLTESKNRYFGKFVWGLSMLRDALNTHKYREMQLAKDKKLLILSISHDIKTPLNAIQLYAKGFEKGFYQNQDEWEEAARSIGRKISEIDGFINEIVKSSTEEVVSIQVVPTDFYLQDLVNKIKTAYEDKCRLQKMEFQVDAFSNMLLYGDLDRIYEAACNLMENAMKYGDGHLIRLSFGEEDSHTWISFFNTGEPVAEQELNHLFDSFFRGSNAGMEKGNGLGLYICKEIMKKCNGEIYPVRHRDGMELVIVCKQS